MTRRGPAKVQPNPFRKGQRFDMRRAPNYRVVDYHQYRRLSALPRGYHWVRSGNDALLVAIGTGVIASVIATRSDPLPGSSRGCLARLPFAARKAGLPRMPARYKYASPIRTEIWKNQ
jgi:hypothetical protein